MQLGSSCSETNQAEVQSSTESLHPALPSPFITGHFALQTFATQIYFSFQPTLYKQYKLHKLYHQHEYRKF